MPRIPLYSADAVPDQAPASRSSRSDAEFMQYRKPVGRGPSGNTWPRWAPQFRHRASVRVMPWLWSTFSSTASVSSDAEKLGQPVPESNFVSDENRGASQQMH